MVSSDEGEFLMATRSRRSNAGNKLKSLLEQELQDMQSSTQHLNDDEINLLFQEEEDDEDFEGASSSDNIDEGNDESDEDSNKKSPPQAEDYEVHYDDEDLMLSESGEDSETNEDDEDAGERELKKQERMQKRKTQKKRNQPAVLKRRSSTSESSKATKKKKLPVQEHNAESLLTTDRRTSKRASAVANKLKIFEKLSKAEKKRKIIQERIKKHKEKEEEHILTQDDRIRIALETEKSNLLSLNKYKEQELSKKQSRLALQQRQKLKFLANELVLQYLSTTWQVTPLNEVEDNRYWLEQLKKREKKKRKYTRRKKTLLQLQREKEELEKQQGKETDNKESSKPVEEKSAPEKRDIDTSGLTNNNIDASPDVPTTSNENNNDAESLYTASTGVANTITSVLQKQEVNDGMSALKNENYEQSSSIQEASINSTENVNVERGPVKYSEDNSNITDEQKSITYVANNESELRNQEITTEEADERQKNSSQIVKQVSFVSEPQIAIINPDRASVTVANSVETTPDLEPDNETTIDEEVEAIYEGPNQQVSKNFVTSYSFSLNPETLYQNPSNYDLLHPDKKPNYDEETVPILHSKVNDEADDEAFFASKNASLVPDLSFLEGFPSFGEFDKKITDNVNTRELKTADIEIKTSAPTGIYVGTVKKHCLINDMECQYFDPKMGIPYSDLTSYRIIQDIQRPDGGYKWFGFENGGIFLKVDERHAKGVPDGF